LLIPINTEFASGNHWLLGVLVRQEEARYFLVIFNSGAGGEIGVELSARLQ
jgi:Ulp1 family protease